MTRIIITGGSGFVGSNMVNILKKNSSYKILSVGKTPSVDGLIHSDYICADICDEKGIMALSEFKPDLIIHCAALANISFCEQSPQLARNVNVNGAANIAKLAGMAGAKLVYLSTDAVFDGKRGNYTEEDKPSPVNVYGRTKLDGEREALRINPNTIIARTNLFGKRSSRSGEIIKNRAASQLKHTFFEDIIIQLSDSKPYPAFYDVKFCPLSIPLLVEYLMGLYEKDASGLFHVASSKSMSKYDFALLVAETFGYDKELVKKETIDSLYPVDNIRRNKDCSLNNSKMLEVLGIKATPTIKQMLVGIKHTSNDN